MKSIRIRNSFWLNREDILGIILLFLPIADFLNGYFIRRYNLRGIGSSYHLVMVAVFVALAYFRKKLVIGKIDKCSFLIIGLLLFSIIINLLMGCNIESITVERQEKLICTVLLIASLCQIYKCKLISFDKLEKVISYQCFIIPVITLVADVTKIGNYTYDNAKTGMIGFYTGRNEPVIVFTIIAGILLTKLYEKFSIKNAILLLCALLSLVFVQSKMGYLLAIIIILLMLMRLLKKLFVKHKFKKLYVMIFVPAFVISVWAFYNVFLNNIDAFLSRQRYQMYYLMDSGLMNYLSSGRWSRITLLLDDMNQGNVVLMTIRNLIGFGTGFTYEQTFEMDYFDMYMYGGIIDVVLLLYLTAYIIRSARKVGNIYAIVVLIVLMYSFFAGHLWNGGVSGIYFSLMNVYFMANGERKFRYKNSLNLYNYDFVLGDMYMMGKKKDVNILDS